MTTDRSKLEALVWRRMPAELKVATNGMKLVAVAGTMKAVSSLSDTELFTILRRNAAINVMLKALEAA